MFFCNCKGIQCSTVPFLYPNYIDLHTAAKHTHMHTHSGNDPGAKQASYNNKAKAVPALLCKHTQQICLLCLYFPHLHKHEVSMTFTYVDTVLLYM